MLTEHYCTVLGKVLGAIAGAPRETPDWPPLAPPSSFVFLTISQMPTGRSGPASSMPACRLLYLAMTEVLLQVNVTCGDMPISCRTWKHQTSNLVSQVVIGRYQISEYEPTSQTVPLSSSKPSYHHLLGFPLPELSTHWHGQAHGNNWDMAPLTCNYRTACGSH